MRYQPSAAPQRTGLGNVGGINLRTARQEELAAVAELCSALFRAVRTTQLYPPAHTLPSQSYDALKEATSRTLKESETVELEVKEDSLLFLGTTVHAEEESKNSMQ